MQRHYYIRDNDYRKNNKSDIQRKIKMAEEYLLVECCHCQREFEQKVTLPDVNTELFSGILALTCTLCGRSVSVNLNNFVSEETDIYRGAAGQTSKRLRLPKCLPSVATAEQEE